MNIYDIYGFLDDNIEKAKLAIEKICGQCLVEHESSYWGIYFKIRLSNGEEIKIYENYFDSEWQEEDFQEYPILVNVSYLSDTDFYISSGLTPLKRIEIESGNVARSYIFEENSPKLIAEKSLVK